MRIDNEIMIYGWQLVMLFAAVVCIVLLILHIQDNDRGVNS